MLSRLLTVSLGVLLSTSLLLAQGGAPHMQPPPQNPTYSPYLNLLRNNAPLYQNYFGLVQPQIQAQNQINQLQTQLRGLQNAPATVAGGTGSELITGKNIGYFTHRSYFLTMGGGVFNPNTYYTGQYGTAGNNTVNPGNQNNAQQSPFSNNNNNLMPFRR